MLFFFFLRVSEFKQDLGKRVAAAVIMENVRASGGGESPLTLYEGLAVCGTFTADSERFCWKALRSNGSFLSLLKDTESSIINNMQIGHHKIIKESILYRYVPDYFKQYSASLKGNRFRPNSSS